MPCCRLHAHYKLLLLSAALLRFNLSSWFILTSTNNKYKWGEMQEEKKWSLHITYHLTFDLLYHMEISHLFLLFTGKIHLFGCEIKASHHSWACRPCDSPCGEAGFVIEILSAFYANTSPCVYCKQQQTSCGDYGPLLSALWNIAVSDPSSEHVCFYSSSMLWGRHIYFIIYRIRVR